MYTGRLDTLVSEKLQADSKAAHFYLECVALQKRIKSREKAKAKAEEEMQLAEEQVIIQWDPTTGPWNNGNIRIMETFKLRTTTSPLFKP